MKTSVLSAAQSIIPPSRQDMLQRDFDAHRFWHEHQRLLSEAWAEWGATTLGSPIDSSLFAPALRSAVEASWREPDQEVELAKLWREVFPGVYSAQFFDPAQLYRLRDYLEQAMAAGIPLRPPYGIALNRGGVMLDPRSAGNLAAPQFQAFYEELMNRYFRPIARMLFPDIIGLDDQTFGFTIRYEPGTDTALQPHTDASSVTLNINMNRPGETYTGSGVRFYEHATQRVEELQFGVGEALLHHGRVPHEARPILSGERSNMVVWLYGANGRTPRQGHQPDPKPANKRWCCPQVRSDGFAPF
ncbi:MAG: 2OG-Fe(II) oxygenase [Alphaproteobacteria bacterium]|nr:2OG-Fe(II) oxygenase [Alphaproteobacteria bacterium]